MNNILGSMGLTPTNSTLRREENGKKLFGGGSRGGGRNDIIPKGYRGGVLEQFTPEQMELFQNLFSQLSPESNLFKMASGDQSFFDEMERPALRDFGALQGNMASRFSQQGLGARRSSGFQNAMNREGSDFAQRLSANRQNLSRQALQDLFELSHMLMGERPYERILAGKEQKEPGFWNQFGSSFAGASGKGAGQFLFGG